MALGLATCLIILLFVKNELNYDRFNEKADRMVRVVFRADIDGGKINEANVMPPVAQTLLNDYPEVEEATRIRQYGKPKVSFGAKDRTDRLADGELSCGEVCIAESGGVFAERVTFFFQRIRMPGIF